MRKLITHVLMAASVLASMIVPATSDACDHECDAVISGAVTHKKKKYVKNTVVYIEKAASNFKTGANDAKMDQTNQIFDPFVLPVVKGTEVTFLNNDNTGHNVFSPDGEKYDLGTWPMGEARSYKFDKEGVYAQLCKMHPSMLAYVVVLQNPYFAVTQEDGSFEIKGVPPGEYSLAVWNERRRADPVPVKVTKDGITSIEIKLTR